MPCAFQRVHQLHSVGEKVALFACSQVSNCVIECGAIKAHVVSVDCFYVVALYASKQPLVSSSELDKFALFACNLCPVTWHFACVVCCAHGVAVVERLFDSVAVRFVDLASLVNYCPAYVIDKSAIKRVCGLGINYYHSLGSHGVLLSLVSVLSTFRQCYYKPCASLLSTKTF